MATQAQITSVINLHGIDDRLTILSEYPVTTPNESGTTYDIGSGGSYKDQDGLHGMGDPYELAAAQLAQVVVTVTPAEGATGPGPVGLELTGATMGTTNIVDLDVSVSYKGQTISDDTKFNFITTSPSLTVDENGLVTYDGTGSGSGQVRIEWKQDTSKFTFRTVNYTDV